MFDLTDNLHVSKAQDKNSKKTFAASPKKLKKKAPTHPIPVYEKEVERLRKNQTFKLSGVSKNFKDNIKEPRSLRLTDGEETREALLALHEKGRFVRGVSAIWLGLFAHAQSNAVKKLVWFRDAETRIANLALYGKEKFSIDDVIDGVSHNENVSTTEFQDFDPLKIISLRGPALDDHAIKTFVGLLRKWKDGSCNAYVFAKEIARRRKNDKVHAEDYYKILCSLLLLEHTTLSILKREAPDSKHCFVKFKAKKLFELELTDPPEGVSTHEYLLETLSSTKGKQNIEVCAALKKLTIRLDLGAIFDIQMQTLDVTCGYRTTTKYTSNICEIPDVSHPFNRVPIEEARLLALLSAFHPYQTGKFGLSRVFNFETIAAIMGRKPDFEKRNIKRLDAYIANIGSVFCSDIFTKGRATIQFDYKRYSRGQSAYGKPRDIQTIKKPKARGDESENGPAFSLKALPNFLFEEGSQVVAKNEKGSQVVANSPLKGSQVVADTPPKGSQVVAKGSQVVAEEELNMSDFLGLALIENVREFKREFNTSRDPASPGEDFKKVLISVKTEPEEPFDDDDCDDEDLENEEDPLLLSELNELAQIPEAQKKDFATKIGKIIDGEKQEEVIAFLRQQISSKKSSVVREFLFWKKSCDETTRSFKELKGKEENKTLLTEAVMKFVALREENTNKAAENLKALFEYDAFYKELITPV